VQYKETVKNHFKVILKPKIFEHLNEYINKKSSTGKFEAVKSHISTKFYVNQFFNQQFTKV